MTTPARGRLHNRTGEDACPERRDRNADAHLKRQVMGREVVVAITSGRPDLGIPGKHVKALQHLMRFLKNHISSEGKAYRR